jgi:hypothetical protein
LQTAGIVLSVLASAGATVVLFVLLRGVTTPKAAWWAVVLFTFGPLSFIMVLGYAESLFLLLLFTALLLAQRRRYGWIVPIALVLAFTRPGALALALGLGILFAVRWFRRGVDPFPRRQRAWLIAAAVTSAIAGMAWTYIADLITGTKDAYLLTETAWWIPYVGDGHFLPLTPWFRFFGTYLGIVGFLVVLGFMALFAWWISSRPARKLGLVITAFTLSYGLYLFAVFLPQQSTFRVLQAAAVLLLWTLGNP